MHGVTKTMVSSNQVIKTLPFSLDDLGIPKLSIDEEIIFKDVDVLNSIIVNGLSKESLGNKIKSSLIFNSSSSYKKYFNVIFKTKANTRVSSFFF